MSVKKNHSSSTASEMEIEDVLELFLIKLQELDHRLDKLESHADYLGKPICAGVS
ncbi:MAG: hypothetical protein ACTSP4_14375 [Candidatus Hodarchaeales archaeon]